MHEGKKGMVKKKSRMTSRFLRGQLKNVGIIHQGKEYKRNYRVRVDKRFSVLDIMSLRYLVDIKVMQIPIH